MTRTDFLIELLDEALDAAVDYGEDPSEANETRLAVVTDALYEAIEANLPMKVTVNT